MGKISVIIKEPHKNPRHVNISNDLFNLQKTVGGYIECVTISTDLCVICDEEGRFKDYEHCCTLCGVEFVGTVIFAGIKGEDLSEIPITFHQFKQVFKNLWEYAE